MKRILATAAIVAMSATAFAGGDLDLRSGYTGTTSNSTASTNNQSFGGLGADRARVGFTGSAGAVTGKMQLDLLTANVAAGSIIKFAEVTNKWSDSMSLTAGKLDESGMSGFEGKRSSGDMYFTSASYMKNYFSGLRFTWMVTEKNSLDVYAMNEAFASSGAATSSNGYGLQYEGAAGDLGYVVSYHVVPQTNATSTTYSNKYINFGLSYKLSDWLFSFDYDMNTYEKQSVKTANDDATKNSMVLMVDYNLGNWVPQLKYESSTNTDISTLTTGTGAGANDAAASYNFCPAGGACSVALTQFTIGTEYKPVPTDKFRYHIMYTSKTATGSGTGATATNKSVTANQVIAGFRWQADFLK